MRPNYDTSSVGIESTFVIGSNIHLNGIRDVADGEKKVHIGIEDDAANGGVYVAFALRNLRAGERLCYNYGPDELLGWHVHRRKSGERRRAVVHRGRLL